jgi:glycine/D-amino acid oxidase-like deaminating enzyme
VSALADARLQPLWWDDANPHHGTAHGQLASDLDVDVAIVGGGLTGLWTAHYLLAGDPHLRVAIVEADRLGAGASARNGGWCSALLPMSWRAIAARYGPHEAVRFQRAMFDTVDEVRRVAEAAGIDCHYQKGGTLHVARSAPQQQRIVDELHEAQHFGFGTDDYRALDAAETRRRIGMSGACGALFTPHCAALQPALLTRELAQHVVAQGARVFEHTPVLGIEPNRATTSGGRIRADVVVRATEAFTVRLDGQGRAVAPIYSLMVATEPLPDEVWLDIGLEGRETFSDARHTVIYGQRTADNRLAFGGRGAPYHWASSIDTRHENHPRVHARLCETLHQLFPATMGAAITHRWGGAVGIPRDWWCSVGYDRPTGTAWAGGYVGDGLSTTNLAGRTLADLIRGDSTDLVTLPWVGHRSPRWEPEPLRYVGINTMVRIAEGADRYEARQGVASRWRTALLSRLTGG